jgi:hypothetical protein
MIDYEDYEDWTPHVVPFDFADNELTPDDLLDAVDEANEEFLRHLIYRILKPGDNWKRVRPRTLEETRALAKRLIREQIEKPTASKQTLTLVHYVDGTRMTQTELCLRLALYLLAHDMVTSDVTVSLTGREVLRRGAPMFAVAAFLERHGGSAPVGAGPRAHGRYSMNGRTHGIIIVPEGDVPDVVAEVGPGGRLIVQTASGPLVDSSTSYEHTLLDKALGRVLRRPDVGPDDLPVVAVPRSSRLRRLAAETRAMPRVAGAGVSIVTVGRNGMIEGLPLFEAYRPPPWPEVEQ